MSATPEMKWERSKVKLSTMEILLCDNGTSIQVYGPSREAVAQKILSMEQVAATLAKLIKSIEPSIEGPQLWPTLSEARAALAEWEGVK